MKTLLLISFIFISVLTYSQELYLTIEPITKRTGIIFHYNNNILGAYSGISYSYNYKHYKIVIGSSIKITDYFKISIGYNYQTINNDKVYKNSFDLGVFCKLTNRWYMLAITDPLNWQTSIGVGIKLNKP